MPKVLLIDDDSHFRRLVRSTLEQMDLTVIEASTLYEASVEAQACQFDLIILDGLVRDLDGEDWLRRMRAMGDQTDVMFVSAAWRSTEAYYRLIHELGVRLVVHKPISCNIFAEQVRQTISAFRPAGEPSQVDSELDNELAMISREFAEELPTRLQELKDSLDELSRAEDADSGSYARAINLAHTLRGSGGSLGYAWVTDMTASIEEQLRVIARGLTPKNTLALLDMRVLVANSIERAKATCEAAVRQAPQLVRAGNPPGQRCSTPLVIVIDSDVFFTRRVESLLTAEDIIVTSFTDTVRALDLIGEIAPDLLMLSVDMPGLSGYDVCRFVREDKRWQELPILIVSPDSSAAARTLAIETGATDYVVKPIANADLSRRVQQYLPGRRGSIVPATNPYSLSRSHA